MAIARNLLQRLTGATFLATASFGAAHAAPVPIPEAFHGIWIVGVAEDSACKASDFDKHENDGLLKVDKKAAHYWESYCEVKRMRPPQPDGSADADLTMTCGGEGEMSSTREIWSVIQIGSRKALVMTRLEASNSLPVESKKPLTLRRALGSRVYLACE